MRLTPPTSTSSTTRANDHLRQVVGSMREGGSHVLILSHMSQALVILEDSCLFKQYGESFVLIPLLQAPETDSSALL